MICDRHYLDSLCLNFAQFIYNGYITLHCTEYMLQKLGIQEDKVPELCVSLYKVYGTTMAGLKVLSISQLKLYINWRFFFIWCNGEQITQFVFYALTRQLAMTLIMMIFTGNLCLHICYLFFLFIFYFKFSHLF